jgi:hypothetical protein
MKWDGMNSGVVTISRLLENVRISGLASVCINLLLASTTPYLLSLGTRSSICKKKEFINYYGARQPGVTKRASKNPN